MRIGEFNFAVMAGAGGDEKIIRRRAPSCFAATVGQLASALPNFLVDRQLTNALLIIAERARA